MAPLLFLALAALFFAVFRLVPLPDSPGFRMLAQLGLSLLLLVGPVAAYSFLAAGFVRKAVNRIGQSWCAERQARFERVERHKNHFTVVYKENEAQHRAKFRVKFIPTTWRVKEVMWL